MAGETKKISKRELPLCDDIGKQAKEICKVTKNIIETVREPCIVLDSELKVKVASRSFYKLFKVAPNEITGHSIYDLGSGQWNMPTLRKLLTDILTKNKRVKDYKIECDFPNIDKRELLVNSRRIRPTDTKSQMILLAIENIPSCNDTKHKAMKKKLDELERFQKLAVARELKMIELKTKIKELSLIILELNGNKK